MPWRFSLPPQPSPFLIIFSYNLIPYLVVLYVFFSEVVSITYIHSYPVYAPVEGTPHRFPPTRAAICLSMVNFSIFSLWEAGGEE